MYKNLQSFEFHPRYRGTAPPYAAFTVDGLKICSVLCVYLTERIGKLTMCDSPDRE